MENPETRAFTHKEIGTKVREILKECQNEELEEIVRVALMTGITMSLTRVVALLRKERDETKEIETSNRRT